MKFGKTVLSSTWRIALYCLLAITLLNYVAQIPYYMHFYGVHHVLPSPLGVAFLVVTFIIFLAGYILIFQLKRIGWWILLLFLLMEFGGYLLHNLSGAFLRDLPTGDPLFFTVSLIGYLNFVTALVYLVAVVKNYRALLM